jgi:putative membrane protein
MQKSWQTTGKAIILLLFAAFFGEKYLSGKLYDYIGARFGWLVVLAAVFFGIIGIAYFRETANPDHEPDHEHGDEHSHAHKTTVWPLAILAVPLILGVVIPSRPLGPIEVANQGVSTDVSAPAADVKSSLTIVPAERNILDWARAIGASKDPAALDGQAADVIGFVYRDVRFQPNQFMVARFAVSCCVADARAMGLVVQSANSAQFKTGAWIRVKGAFQAGSLDGSPIPVVAAGSITPVDQPAQPYLYP